MTSIYETMVWEQLENESDSEFDMFQIYRTLAPSERNTGRMWEIYSERNNLSKRYNKKIEEIATRNNWYERALQFDAFYDSTLVEYAGKDQFRELISYRKRQRELAGRLTEVSLGLIRVAQQRLLNIRPEELTPALLPKYIQAAAQIAAMASESEASALLLTELAARMNDDIENDVYTEDSLKVWEDE